MYTVLFDVGNVLISFDHRIVSQQLADHIPVAQRTATVQDDIHRFTFGSDDRPSPTVELDRGTKPIDALRDEISDRFGLQISHSEFERVWSSIFSDALNVDTIDCLNRLRGMGVNVAICSNTNAAHWNALLEMQPTLRHLCDRITCFLSYEIGKLKADPGFFDSIANTTFGLVRGEG